jgi:hypothetical protein
MPAGAKAVESCILRKYVLRHKLARQQGCREILRTLVVLRTSAGMQGGRQDASEAGNPWVRKGSSKRSRVNKPLNCL